MSYVIRTLRVTELQKNLIYNEVLRRYSPEAIHFFSHILFGNLHLLKRGKNFVPFAATLMQQKWGGQYKAIIQLDKLIEEGLIEVTDFDKENGLSREFKVREDIILSFLDATPSSNSSYLNCQYYNLVTGKKMNQWRGHKRTDETNNSLPTLILNSMDTIECCIVDTEAIEKHLRDLRSQWSLNGDEKSKAKWENDKNCYENIRKRITKDLGNGIIKYKPEYMSQPFGRISEVGGGMQSCSRKMKAEAFKSLFELMDLYNWDLKSSQVWGLIQCFEEASLDASWLYNYLKRNKQEFADEVGISVDCWKKCLLALIMGGQLPQDWERTEDNIANANVKIMEYLLEEAEDNIELAMQYLGEFETITDDLKKQIKLWHEWLIEEHLKQPGVSSFPGGKQYVRNATGATFCISNYKNKKGKLINENELKRRLAAFWLQGTEAAFIHHLTIISREYGFEVLNNQHDGLVTLGQIPEQAVAIARERSGLKYAKIEQKSFT